MKRRAALSVMRALDDVPVAAAWDQAALGAELRWDLGSVAGLDIDGAPLLLGQPADNGWLSPKTVGTTTTRIELFVDDPDAFIGRAVRTGAIPVDPVETYEMPWGHHRQGTFLDPFGHLWFVGDHTPLDAIGDQ